MKIVDKDGKVKFVAVNSEEGKAELNRRLGTSEKETKIDPEKPSKRKS